LDKENETDLECSAAEDSTDEHLPTDEQGCVGCAGSDVVRKMPVVLNEEGNDFFDSFFLRILTRHFSFLIFFTMLNEPPPPFRDAAALASTSVDSSNLKQ